MDYKTYIGREVFRLRTAKGLSQERLGFKVKRTKTSIGKVEAGLNTPALEDLAELLRVLGARLVFRIEDGTPDPTQDEAERVLAGMSVTDRATALRAVRAMMALPPEARALFVASLEAMAVTR
jgi:transcriptional regulator with XRE-family HTH domain